MADHMPGTTGLELSRDEAEAVLWQLAGQSATDANGPSPGARSDRLITEHPPHERTASPFAPPPDAGHRILTADTLSGLIESVPDALVIAGPDGRIVLINRQTERLFGYRRDELVGQPVELLVPERFRDRHALQRGEYFAAPHERPMGKGLELFGRRKDGSEVPVEISLSPLETNAGPLVVSSVRDITERKRSDAQLRKMEARYRTLVEGIPAVTFMAALDEGVNELYVSPQIEELLGFSQEEWLDDPILWFTQLHPADRGRWHEEFARTLATGEHFQSVYRFVARDGRVVWVHGEAQVVRDDGGRPLFLQGVAFDITGIKRAEEELRALNQTLEDRVTERTEELTRSNAALEQFGYVVAHDLRQPLRTMKSYIQKLAEHYRGQFDAEGDDYVIRSVNAADRMRVLIDDLLAYSRVRTQGKEPEPVDCAEVLQAAVANLQAAVEESGAVVTADSLPHVVADPTQLAQLFQNLVGNALKFRAADRPPEVRVAALRQADRWVISVTDNGIGIESQYLERIFGLGERLHSMSKYPGNGIGLATCEKIVQRHGGRIWATSDGPDQGTTIGFTLPAVD